MLYASRWLRTAKTPFNFSTWPTSSSRTSLSSIIQIRCTRNNLVTNSWSYLLRDWLIWCSKSCKLFSRRSLSWRKPKVWVQSVNSNKQWIRMTWMIEISWLIIYHSTSKHKEKSLISIMQLRPLRETEILLNKRWDPKMTILKLFWTIQTCSIILWVQSLQQIMSNQLQIDNSMPPRP